MSIFATIPIIFLAGTPLIAAAAAYLFRLNLLVAVTAMLVVSILALAYRRYSGESRTHSKWIVDSAFEVCAVISIVASVTAIIPVFDQKRTESDRLILFMQADSAVQALTDCATGAPQSCCSTSQLREAVVAFVTHARQLQLALDKPSEWRDFREKLQHEARTCRTAPVEVLELLKSVNAYTKIISDHVEFGVFRSSLHWLNDIKASVMFSLVVIFYLCQSLWLKLLRVLWLSIPE